MFLRDKDGTVCVVDTATIDWEGYTAHLYANWRHEEFLREQREIAAHKKKIAKFKQVLTRLEGRLPLNASIRMKRKLAYARREFIQKSHEPHRPFELQCLLRGHEEEWASWLNAISCPEDWRAVAPATSARAARLAW